MSIGLSKRISLFISFCLIFEQTVFAQSIDISAHFANFGRSIAQTDKFRPLHLRSISYDSQSQGFKLFLDKGDFIKGLSPQGTVPDEKLQEETQTLFNYFWIGLTLPNDKFWVNLRPDSPENILDPDLEKTDIGRIFLEADLQLKKDTASFTSPQTKEGKEYWDKLYKKAGELFGSENITIPTITRPWIVPNEIIIRESLDSAYIYKATLKVMLEEDYLKSNQKPVTRNQNMEYNFSDQRLKELNEYSTQLIKEAIIPKLTYEVNTSKRYAPLRQVYYSLILAQWFKARFGSQRTEDRGQKTEQTELLQRIDSRDLTNLTSQEPYDKQTYFKQYQKSFKDGEYNLSEPVYTPFGQSVRQYMSGGMGPFNNLVNVPLGTNSPTTTSIPGITSSPLIRRIGRKLLPWFLFFSILSTSILSTSNGYVIGDSRTSPADEKSLISRIIDGGGYRIWNGKEHMFQEAGEAVRLSLDILKGKVDLDKKKEDLNKRFLNGIVALVNLYDSFRQEIIAQGGISILLSALNGKYENVAIETLQHLLIDAKEEDVQQIILGVFKDENSEVAALIYGHGFLIEEDRFQKVIAPIIVAKVSITKLLNLVGRKDYKYQNKTLELLARLVLFSPGNLTEEDADRIVSSIQQALYDNNPFVRSEAAQSLRKIITTKPKYNNILKQVSERREKINVLPENRASKDIVLILVDDYIRDMHGFLVASQLLSEIEGRPINLNNEDELKKLAEELGVSTYGIDISYLKFKVAKKLALRHGIEIKFFGDGVPEEITKAEETLEGMITKDKNKTTIVSMSMGDIIVTKNIFGETLLTNIKEPQRLNGIIPLERINDLGAKELVFIVAAGNKGSPRFYTHPIQDNYVVVGAAEKKENGWGRTSYSDYGDVTFYAPGTLPSGEYGTSFAAPKVSAILGFLLAKNPKLSVKDALNELKRQAEPIAGHPDSGVLKGKTSSPVQSQYRKFINLPSIIQGAFNEPLKKETTDIGGIDFTHLPIVTQAITNLGSSPLRPSSYPSLRQLNLKQEYQAIERVASSGITPSPERLMSFLQASCLQDRIGEEKDKTLGLLAEVLRDEESNLRPTEPGLRDILIVLESATSPQQLKEIFLGR